MREIIDINFIHPVKGHLYPVIINLLDSWSENSSGKVFYTEVAENLIFNTVCCSDMQPLCSVGLYGRLLDFSLLEKISSVKQLERQSLTPD